MSDVKVKVKVKQYTAVRARSTRTATGACMPYGITQSCLPPGRGSVSRPYAEIPREQFSRSILAANVTRTSLTFHEEIGRVVRVGEVEM